MFEGLVFYYSKKEDISQIQANILKYASLNPEVLLSASDIKRLSGYIIKAIREACSKHQEGGPIPPCHDNDYDDIIEFYNDWFCPNASKSGDFGDFWYYVIRGRTHPVNVENGSFYPCRYDGFLNDAKAISELYNAIGKRYFIDRGQFVKMLVECVPQPRVKQSFVE